MRVAEFVHIVDISAFRFALADLDERTLVCSVPDMNASSMLHQCENNALLVGFSHT
jgi:hypothetical protein